MSVEAHEICGKCGKAKRSRSAGSLTQWLFSPDACDCDFLKLAAEADQTGFTSERLCSTCGKRITDRRKGSLTHWVFRAESCTCNKEEVLSSADFSPSRLPLPGSVSTRANSYEPDIALTAQLGLPADRYAAISLLGTGSGARVYKCWDLNLNKPVAVKLLAGIKMQDKDLVAFQNEARSTSALSHPSIVRVLDFGLNANEQPYMVMEFIDGQSLEVLIDQHGPMPVSVLVLIMISICSGMHHAHQSGIFHRDLKSSNIMIPLSGAGVPIGKVIDFGVAAMRKGDATELVYQGHPIAGTPGYMSPDQLRGEDFDQRSDIYSLGCTMFQALTGRMPFRAKTSIDVLAKHANETPPPLVQANSDIDYPDKLEAIIVKTLSKKKEDRFQSMLELKAALEEFLEERGSQPTDAEDEPVAGGGFRKTLTIVGVVGGAIAIAGLAGIGFNILAGKTSQLDSTLEIKQPIPHSVDEFATGAFHLDSVSMSDDKLKTLPRDTRELDLVASDVTDEGIKYIVDLPLTYLRLDACNITDAGLKQLNKIKTLQILFVGDNPNITRDGVSGLSELPNLDFISLNGSALSDDDLEVVSHMKTLRRVSLGAMKNVTGTGLVHLKSLPHLVSLRLSGIDFSPAGVKQLGELTRTEDLEARTAKIDGNFINALLAIKNLEALNLSETNLTDKQLLQLSQLKKLKILRVEKCPLLTPAGVSIVAKRLPHCTISDGRRSAF